MTGCNEMLRRIMPEKNIRGNMPFPKLQGDIVHVDDTRSSRKYMNSARSFQNDDLDALKKWWHIFQFL